MNYELFNAITKDWPEYYKVKYLIEGPEWAIILAAVIRKFWNEAHDNITIDDIALFANDNGLLDQTNLEVIE